MDGSSKAPLRAQLLLCVRAQNHDVVMRSLLDDVLNVAQAHSVGLTVAACVRVPSDDADCPASPNEIRSKTAAAAAELRGPDSKAVMKHNGTRTPTTRIWLSANKMSRFPKPMRVQLHFLPMRTREG